MATDIYSMLTGGYDPRAEQMKQQQAFQQRLGQATTPQSFLAAVGSNMGNMLGQGVSSALGGPSKQQKIQRILQSVGNISDPLGQAKEAYKLLQQEGLGQEAQKVLQRIQELQKEADALKQTADLANVDFSSAAAVQQAAQAALRSGDRAGGVALLKEAKQLKEAEGKQTKRKALVESRAAGIVRNNPDMPEEVVPLVAGDDDLFKEWGKTLFEAKKNNYDLSYQTFDGERVMRLVDKETGTLVKEVVLGKAAQTGTNVEVNTGDMQSAADKAKGKGIGEEIAADLSATRKAAQTANENLPKMYTALNILKTQPITTGLGYQFYDIINQIRSQYLNDKKAGVEVTNNQYLDSLVGADVFNAIADLGIGARGIDTPAEKDFLLEVVTGKRSLSENALIAITEMRIKNTEKSVNKFNDYLSKGDYKDLETILGRKLSPIELRNAPTVSNWN